MEGKERLFEYAIIWHPSKKEIKAGDKSVLVEGPKTILAKNVEVVNMTAVKAIPEKYGEQLDQIEIAVRPF